MAYNELMVLNKKALENIKNVVDVYTKEEIKKYHDVNIREIFKDFDYLLEIKDYNVIIENSYLKNELEKIGKLKMLFTQVNNEMLKEKSFAETDDLEETSDREILNRSMVINLRRRRLNFTNQDAIYLKNKVDESYNEIKGYYIDLSLSWQYNRDFEAIAKKLKGSVASKKQEFMYFKAIYKVSDGKKQYAIVIPELHFNNERFTKDLYKLFLPYTSWALCEVIQTNIKEARTWKQSNYPLIKMYDSRVIQLQWQ